MHSSLVNRILMRLIENLPKPIFVVLTWLDVIPYDGHMVVPVRPSVLMPEANDMAQFMYHNAKLVTVLPNGDSLGPVAATTHIGTTPSKN